MLSLVNSWYSIVPTISSSQHWTMWSQPPDRKMHFGNVPGKISTFLWNLFFCRITAHYIRRKAEACCNQAWIAEQHLPLSGQPTGCSSKFAKAAITPCPPALTSWQALHHKLSICILDNPGRKNVNIIIFRDNFLIVFENLSKKWNWSIRATFSYRQNITEWLTSRDIISINNYT